ncbi:molecular chaperone DnaJ [Actinoplanes oblitus]|uniref:Molecular chaperone DnaJ n=1 Tax=Actinoplanes oblitus TaxID=3040509 RepID=A0ABY8WP44_9ACTN|nr:molecular chaperone DnaJ [Actinoplanes oblitus]WIM99413.1 molecular chaperone DnaJ [Actinoplanes oblitus]
MCNPRRIQVSATRHLAQEWERQLERVVQRSAEVLGEARIAENLGASLGRPTLIALERVLERSPAWRRDGETYRLELDGGYVAYHLDRRELEIVAQVRDRIAATGRAATRVSGSIDTEVSASGEGVYYDDGWGRLTPADARREARRNLAENLDRAEETERLRAYAAAEREHGGDLEAAAGQEADAKLAHDRAVVSAELRRKAAALITEVGAAGRAAFHAVLAEAYRDAIMAYARVRGATNLVMTEENGVVDIQFEIGA